MAVGDFRLAARSCARRLHEDCLCGGSGESSGAVQVDDPASAEDSERQLLIPHAQGCFRLLLRSEGVAAGARPSSPENFVPRFEYSSTATKGRRAWPSLDGLVRCTNAAVLKEALSISRMTKRPLL